MKILNLTFDSPEQNLACDEALLEAAEAGAGGEVLRFWSPQKRFVVAGYSGKIAEDVHISACRRKKIPVFRRVSGGGTVLQGPGCLNYSLVLSAENRPQLSGITSSNHFIMEVQRRALSPLAGAPVLVSGITDLTVGGLKFSGNAQRRKKKFVLFHGTFLLDFDIAGIGEFLTIPHRQPDYRANRTHQDFLVNLGVPDSAVSAALSAAWQASGDLSFSLEKKMEELIESRYSKEEWNFKF